MNIFSRMYTLVCVTLITSCSSDNVQEVSIARYLGNRQCAISLTFDDGLKEDLTLIAPHLEYYGLRGTFAIIGSKIRDLNDTSSLYLSWPEVADLYKRGHEISNHTWTHRFMLNLSDEELHWEVEHNDSAIQNAIGIRPQSFVYPYNEWDERVRRFCSNGRIGTREDEFGLGQANTHQNKESINAWLQKQINKGEWGISMTHGIYTAWDHWDEPQLLWNLMRELSYKSDTIWTATFAQVAAYVTERDTIQLEVTQNKDVTTITPHIGLNPLLFTEPLTMKVKGRNISNSARYNKLNAWRAVQDGRNLPISRQGDVLLFDFNPFGGTITFEPLKEDPLAGKKICFLGDNYVANHQQPIEQTWHSKVAARHGMTYCNYGRNGGTIAFDRTSYNFGKALYEQYAEMDDDADYVVIIAGHNDAYFVSQDTDSLSAFVKHLDELCIGLKKKYPNAKLAFISPWNVAHEGFPVVMRHLQETCLRHEIPFLNAVTTSGINVENEAFRKRYFQAADDHAHLNSEGHDLLIKWGETFLMSL